VNLDLDPQPSRDPQRHRLAGRRPCPAKRPAILSSAAVSVTTPGMVRARPMDDVPGLLGGWRRGGVGQPRRVRWQGAIRRRCELARPELSGVSRGGSGRDAQAAVRWHSRARSA